MTQTITDDFPGDSSTTGVLVVGIPLAARFERLPDFDWVKVDLTAGTSYVFSMPVPSHGWDAQSYYGAVNLELRAPDGALIWDETGYGSPRPAFEYTPTVSGTYFVATLGWGPEPSELGSYLLSAAIKPPVPDDFPSNASTSGVLEASGKASGTFDFPGDIDWFRFRGEAGKQYAFGSETKAPFVATGGMRIIDSAGNEYPPYPFSPPVTGDYFVSVAGYETGTYSIFSRTLPTDDYAEDMSTSAVLRPGAYVTGGIQYRFDTDYIKTTLVEGIKYTFELGAHAYDINGLSVSIKNTGGTYFGMAQYSSGEKTALTFTAPATGDYFFVIDADNLTSGVTRSPYTLTWVRPNAADDFGDNNANASPITLGATVNGVLDGASDIDVMKVLLEAGKSYVFDMATGQAGAPVRMYIADSEGGYEFSNAGLQLSYTFTPERSGSYYVSASTATTASGSFSFRAALETDDFGATPATAGQLMVDGSVSGKLGSGGGDRDWFGINLTAGERYVFSAESADLSYTGGVATGRILDASGNLLASSLQSGLHVPSMIFSPTTSGKYFFEMYSERDSGAYTVAATRIASDDFGQTRETAGRLTEGVWQQGQLELAGDSDSFKLAVTAGNQYVIEVILKAVPGSFGFTEISILDSAGAAHWEHDSGDFSLGNHYVVLKPTLSGDYLVTIDGAVGGATGTYVINARDVGRDDYSYSVSTQGVLAINGQLNGNLEHRHDLDLIRVSLTAGKTYAFELLGAIDHGGTFATQNGSSFRLYDGSINPMYGVADQLDSASPRIEFTAQRTGDVFLFVGGADRNDGTYTVKATEISADAIAPALAHQWLANGATGASLTGDIVLTFNEAIKVAGNAIRLRDASGAYVALDNAGIGQSSLAIGNKLVIDPAATLKPGTTYTLDLPAGSVLDEAGNPYAGVKSFSFTTMAATSTASAGNDLLPGHGRGGSIAGGAGLDTAIYSETMASYRVLRNGADATVWHGAAAAGESLTGVERLLFADGAIALDIGGTAGQAYRLYQAAFDRVPDEDGLGFWIAQMDSGATLDAVAREFVESAEFKSLYGVAPSNAQYVDLLYDNVLHRKGDQAGINFWLNSLAAGVQRDDLLASFSESAENQTALAAVIGNGFVYQPFG